MLQAQLKGLIGRIPVNAVEKGNLSAEEEKELMNPLNEYFLSPILAFHLFILPKLII